MSVVGIQHYSRQHYCYCSNVINIIINCAQQEHTHTRTQTQLFNGPWSVTTRVGRYQKKHSPTHTHPDHRTSFIIFLHLQRSMAQYLCSFYVLDNPLVQPLSRSSLVFLLVLDPQLHTPYISSPNHLLFAAKNIKEYETQQHCQWQHHITLHNSLQWVH